MSIQPNALPIGPPVIPAPPAGKAIYGADALYLCPLWTRDSFAAAFPGQQAPPYDQTKPVKGWAYKGKGDPVTYVSWSNGQKVMTTIVADWAATLNLPGAYNWPKYTIDPTSAYIQGPGGPFAINPQLLSNEDDAIAVANAAYGMPPNSVTEYAPSGPFSFVWGMETRRMWQVRVTPPLKQFPPIPPDTGTELTAGFLIAAQYANGIGAPGHWDKDAAGVAVWHSDVPPSVEPPNALPSPPVPMRDLVAGEVWVVTNPLFPVWQVRNTNVPWPSGVGLDPAGPVVVLPSSGGVAAHDPMLDTILGLTQRIVNRTGA